MTSTYTAYVTISNDPMNATVLEIIPGAKGSGLSPVLSVDLEEDDKGHITTDLDDVLAEHGWKTIKTHIPGVIDQPGHWTPTDFGLVASVEPIDA